MQAIWRKGMFMFSNAWAPLAYIMATIGKIINWGGILSN
jgi:hypothetical protein